MPTHKLNVNLLINYYFKNLKSKMKSQNIYLFIIIIKNLKVSYHIEGWWELMCWHKIRILNFLLVLKQLTHLNLYPCLNPTSPFPSPTSCSFHKGISFTLPLRDFSYFPRNIWALDIKESRVQISGSRALSLLSETHCTKIFFFEELNK